MGDSTCDSMMKTFTLLFVVVTMTIALTAGAMASPDQDLIQCVSWNGTYSLMNLYTTFNKTNPSGQTLTPVPGTNPEELVAYNLCGMCTWSNCLRGTHVGLINVQDSSCKSLASLSVALPSSSRPSRSSLSATLAQASVPPSLPTTPPPTSSPGNPSTSVPIRSS